MSTVCFNLAFAAPANEGCQTGTPDGEQACLKPDLHAVEGALDRQLYQLNRRMKASPRTAKTTASRRLNASQQTWKQYRENYCAVEGLASAGTGEWLKVRILECEMRMTKDRLESLRDVEAALE
ncbi:MAG TPA: lysozyme inhibitor LprI family protein [Burkholderiales bacterium]